MKIFKLFALFFMSIIMGIMNTSCSDEEELSKISFLEGTSLKMTIGSTETLHLVGEPSSIELPLCDWTCNNTEVLSVNNQGQITAKNVGNATVTASTKSGLMATCSVVVDPINVTGIKLSDENRNLLVGESFTIIAEVAPSNATYPALIWSSSDNNIASVDNGKITAVGVGSCQIIVEDEKRMIKKVCNVSVAPVEMEKISFEQSSVEIELNRTLTLNPIIEPENTTFPELLWESLDSTIVTVDNGEISAHELGTCTVVVTNKDKSLKAECIVTVVPVKITEINTTLNSNQKMPVGGTCDLSRYFTVEPKDADKSTLIWSSSDERIASVDKNGTIEGKSKGVAAIKVETKDGNCSHSLTFTVKDIKDFVSLNVNSNGAIMQVGNSIISANLTLSAKVVDSWGVEVTSLYLYDNYNKKTITTKSSYGPVKISNDYCTTDPYLNYYYWICKFEFNGQQYEISKKAF